MWIAAPQGNLLVHAARRHTRLAHRRATARAARNVTIAHAAPCSRIVIVASMGCRRNVVIARCAKAPDSYLKAAQTPPCKFAFAASIRWTWQRNDASHAEHPAEAPARSAPIQCMNKV
jgi:hypothetical protein